MRTLKYPLQFGRAERLKEEWRTQGIQMGTEGEGGGKKKKGGKKGARSMANDEEVVSEEGERSSNQRK